MKKDKTALSLLSQTEIGKIVGCSRNQVNSVLNGKEIKDKDISAKIYELVAFEDYLIELFLDKDFYDIMNVVIAKARNPLHRKKAALLQHASEHMRYKLEKTVIDRTKNEEEA